MRRATTTFVALAALAAAGCVSLRPFAEVRATLPADRWVDVRGQLVHVEQAGTGEAVLLVHGFGASTYMFRTIQPTLARSFRTVAVDLSGFGYTERPQNDAAYTREGQVAMLLGVMDALGIDRAHLVGHSYGGALSLWVAAEHPNRVRSLVLLDSAAPTYPDDRRSPLAGIGPLAKVFVRWALSDANIRRALEGSIHDDSKVTAELVAAYASRLRLEGVVEAYRGLTAPAPKAPPFDWAAIEASVLVVWGEEDTLVPVSAGRSAAGWLSRAELVVLPGVGHMPTEEDPNGVLAAIVPFLERISAGE
jgi:pimeloyl-ACP methyl ester carboxylesterase